MAWARYNVRIAAAGTVVAIPAAAGKQIKVTRWAVNTSAASLTVDIQDTTGTSLTGVNTMPQGQTYSIPYADSQDAVTNPVMTVGMGLGLQLVTTGTGNINGWIDYFY